MMEKQPAAFMSYVRFVDEHEGGKLTEFRKRLAAEVQVQTGEEFFIFQDRNDIAWGQNWQARIDEALDAVTLLIPIVTPSFFRSSACRAEVERFLDREKKLGRQDLILPVYYVSSPELDELERRDADELARVLASRQFADWRELRFEPFTSPVFGKALEQLASRMRDTFWRDLPVKPVHPSWPRQTTRSRDATAPGRSAASRPPAKTEPPTHVVDPFDRGDFTTIAGAITAARPGDRILVRPGLYDEGLMVDKPLEIIGDGSVTDIIVQARNGSVMIFKANIGRIANLTLRQIGGRETSYCVDIPQGRLELEGCDISCKTSSGVAIRNGADPRLRRNRIHDCKYTGIDVYKDALGTLEDNEITASGYSGVEISARSSPTLRRNQIHNNTHSGVFLHDDGLGMLEDNNITANGAAGVKIRSGSNPTLRRNRINRNNEQAVVIIKGGRGVIEDNDLTRNDQGPWLIDEDCEPNVVRRDNRE